MPEPPRYTSGEPIRIGDRITYWGRLGRVAFVIDTRSFSAEFPEEEWAYLGSGFMIETKGPDLFYFEEPDEELILLGRA